MINRNRYFDQLRGIGIIGVVLIHTFGLIVLFGQGSRNFQFLFYTRILFNFAVPLFIFMSGYFLADKKIDSFSSYTKFLSRQCLKILVPYFLYSAATLIYGAIFSSGTTVSTIIKTLLTGSAQVPYYFIILIIQYYLFLPLLQRFTNRKGFIIAAFFNTVFLILLYFIRLHGRTELPLIITAGVFPAWIVFFHGGICIKRNDLPQLTYTQICLFLVVAVTATVLESLYWLQAAQSVSFALSQLKITSFIFSWAFILFLLKKPVPLNKVLIKMGEYSFGIFLIHIPVMIVAFRFLNIFPGLLRIQPLYQCIYTVLTLGISSLIIYLSNKFLPEKINFVLGFR